MAHGTAEERTERRVRRGGGLMSQLSAREAGEVRELARVVRVAMGRLGASIEPWLDEDLLVSQGMASLLELERARRAEGADDRGAIWHVVGGMRAWARSTSWYRAALPCRIAPLCASLAERWTDGAPADRVVAGDLGLTVQGLNERYLEAGLMFGVSPELMLAKRGEAPGADRMAEAVSALPEQQRRLLTLYFEDGLSFAEIARLLEISAERAQALYGRAGTAIRGCIVTGTRPRARVGR